MIGLVGREVREAVTAGLRGGDHHLQLRQLPLRGRRRSVRLPPARAPEQDSPERAGSLEQVFVGFNNPILRSDLGLRPSLESCFPFSFNLLRLLTQQHCVCQPQSSFCLHQWKYIIFILDSDNTFTNICFTSTKKTLHHRARENILIVK